MSEARRIALYGGTFDPVHDGHLAVARSLVEFFGLEEVLFIPAHVAPHKRAQPPTSALHRYAMLALATNDEPRFCVSTIEIDAPERPYSVETVARLQNEYGAGARLFFVIGADSWAEITTWREWEKLLEMCDHIVVTRPGYELSFEHVTGKIRARLVDLRGYRSERAREVVNNSEPPKIFLTDEVRQDISSTEVRRAITRGNSQVRVQRAVAEYISKYRLYKDNA